MQYKSTKKIVADLQRQINSHKVVFIVCALIVFLSVFVFINNYLSRIRASTTKAFVSFSSSSVIIEAEQPTSGGNVNKISAFDLTLTTDGTELITTVGNPATYPAGDTAIFTPVISPSGLPATTVHIAYVIQKPTLDLPVAISIPISTDGAGNTSLDPNATQEVVGFIANSSTNTYQVVASAGGTPFPSQVPATSGPTPPGGGSGNDYTIQIATRGVLEFTINEAGAPSSTVQPGVSNSPIPGVSNTPTPRISLPSGETPQIQFKIVFESLQQTPELEVRVKATDLIAAITPGPGQQDSCQQPGHAEIFYENVQMIPDASGVYSIKPNTPFTAGAAQYTTTGDGWLPLAGTTAGKAYAFSVKGPRHRSQRMEDTVQLRSGKDNSHVFNWTNIPIAPGDLPDPGAAGRQDCTVNALDLARIEGLLATTDAASLAIADVNYDGVINGNDISKVVNTLSTKPDDD